MIGRRSGLERRRRRRGIKRRVRKGKGIGIRRRIVLGRRRIGRRIM